jgi:carbamoyl-phosphate synthase small subunit
MIEAVSTPSYESKILQNSLNKPTACLVFADGTVVYGQGFGAEGQTTAELCFNTAMTGYQEIMSDPSYKGQIVTFTFPHIGNVGQNAEDLEHKTPHAEGIVVHARPTSPSNWRSEGGLVEWMEKHGQIGIAEVDTRSITRMTRRMGALHVVLCHSKTGDFDIAALQKKAQEFSGLKGLDLAKDVTENHTRGWSEPRWRVEKQSNAQKPIKVVAIDYGAKHNILRCLSSAGCDTIVVLPATASAEEILSHEPDGVFLSNGPGDPAATAEYAVPMIQHIIEKTSLPLFGICLGHQLLGLAMGGKTVKMSHGHHGANHPVKNHQTGRVEITSMNHGFCVDVASLPDTVEETHVSLFDGTNCGLKIKGRPVFSVQHHPEASPGPQDSLYLFEQFVSAMRKN